MPGRGSSCPGLLGEGSQGHSQGSEGGNTAHDGHLEGAPAASPGPQALTASHLGLRSGQACGSVPLGGSPTAAHCLLSASSWAPPCSLPLPVGGRVNPWNKNLAVWPPDRHRGHSAG